MNSAAEDDQKIKKKQWQKVDDAKLRQLIQKNGTRNWSLIAEAIPGRTGKQCRERWHNHLDASIVKADWTAEEDEIIETMQKKLGNQWAKITKLLPGRTDNAVKNRFHLTKRARIRFQNRIFRNSNNISAPEPSTIYNVIPSESEDNCNKHLHRQPLSRSSSVSSQHLPMNRANLQESISTTTSCTAINSEFPQANTTSASQNKSIAHQTCLPSMHTTNNALLFPNVPYYTSQSEYNNSGNHNTKHTNPYFQLPNPLIISSNASNVTPPIAVPAPVYMQQPPRMLTYFQSDYDLDCVSIESTADELEFDVNCFNHHEELLQHCCNDITMIDNYTPKYQNNNNGYPVENCLLPLSTASSVHHTLSGSEW